MTITLDWFQCLCFASCFVLPVAFFVWWRKRVLLLDAFDELEMKARRSEMRTRQRVGALERMPTLDPVITHRSPTPSSMAPDAGYDPEPTWARRPEQDDPAPLFDARVAEVRMHNVDTAKAPFAYDAAPENDNAVPKRDSR